MPEQTKKERNLPGEITVTSSSDEAIRTTIAGLGREIQGLPEPVVVVEGDLLPPKTNTPPLETEGVQGAKPISIEGRLRQLTYSDSGLGFLIRQKRQQRKAA